MPTPTPYSEHSTRHRKLFVPYKSNSVKFVISFFPIMAKKYKNLTISCRSKGDPNLFKAIRSLNYLNFYQGEVNWEENFLLKYKLEDLCLILIVTLWGNPCPPSVPVIFPKSHPLTIFLIASSTGGHYLVLSIF